MSIGVGPRPRSVLPSRVGRDVHSTAKVSMASSSLNELFVNNLEWSKKMTDQVENYFSQHVGGQTPEYLWIGCTFPSPLHLCRITCYGVYKALSLASSSENALTYLWRPVCTVVIFMSC